MIVRNYLIYFNLSYECQEYLTLLFICPWSFTIALCYYDLNDLSSVFLLLAPGNSKPLAPGNSKPLSSFLLVVGYCDSTFIFSIIDSSCTGFDSSSSFIGRVLLNSVAIFGSFDCQQVRFFQFVVVN